MNAPIKDGGRVADALQQIKHSIQQARVPGNDWKRELALIENTIDVALAKAPGVASTSEPRFKVGDRVRVVGVDMGDDCDVGQIGTVLDDGCAPWVRFDTPTRYPLEVCSVSGGTAGYCDCLSQWQLEPVTDEAQP